MPNKPEAQTTEYKSSWQEEYFEWIAGYANAEGGTLYIGVNDDGYVVGVEDTRPLLDKLPNQVASFLGITVSVGHKYVHALGQNLKYGDEVPKDLAQRPINLFARGLLTEEVLSEIATDPENVSNVSESVQALFDAAPGFVKQLRKTKEYRAKIKADLNNWISDNPICQNPDGSLDYVIIKVNAFSHGVPYHGRYYIRSGGTNRELKGA